jgi:hypothetical protein
MALWFSAWVQNKAWLASDIDLLCGLQGVYAQCHVGDDTWDSGGSGVLSQKRKEFGCPRDSFIQLEEATWQTENQDHACTHQAGSQ